MSNRTAKANKAVVAAWERERQLVLEGKGTRDWTLEQQKDIIERGRAYDENGKAFEGHHMKSVEAYPEYQENAYNIEFLTRQEHIEAHGGSFRNSTNGYFNPISHVTKAFSDNDIGTLEITELSSSITIKTVSDTEKIENNSKENEGNISFNSVDIEKINTMSTKEKHNSFILSIKTLISNAKGFIEEHNEEIKMATGLAAMVVTTIVGTIKAPSNKKNKIDTQKHEIHASELDSKEMLRDENRSQNNEDVNQNVNYPSERSSPREHNVSEYDRIQNGKKVHVTSYTRGKDKDN